jgi:hypothetical protein
MTSHELWEVKLSSGQILTVTLDQLDQGFADGHVAESTLVRAFGTLEWSTLADLAGLDDDEAPPTLRDIAPPIVVGGSRGTVRLQAQPLQAVAAPIVVGAARAVATPVSPPSFPPSAYDFTVDVDLGEMRGPFSSSNPFASKKKPLALYAGIAGACLVVLAAVGFVSSAESPAEAAMAHTQANVAASLAASPVTPSPEALPTPAKAPEATNATPGSKLSEAQKSAVLEADKKLAKKKAKKAVPAKKPAKDPFTKGGNPHDPLNKSL